MLTVLIALPLVAALAVLLPRVSARTAQWAWVLIAGAEVAIVAVMCVQYRTPPRDGLAFEQQVAWIPAVNSSYHVGVDGLSLPLIAMSSVLFLACAVFSVRDGDRPRGRAALFLALQGVSLGLFAAADLVLFFVFFDLSIVGMYFVIVGWGHGERAKAALMFFLYTFLGSLALLASFIGLYLAAAPHTFDMVELARQDPLADRPVAGAVVLGAALLGLLIKTPAVPLHTWLPPAHTNAPAIGSAVLAGVLLKMGTYGLVRIGMTMMPGAWRDWAWVILVIGIVSVLWGALVALAQTDLKRLIAYTSVNHMGYVVMALGAAGVVARGTEQPRELAVTGAMSQMVSHGLITGALFLMAGVFLDRTGTYDLARYGGLASRARRLAVLFAAAAFASLGLPGFSGFIAEFQMFTGSIATVPISAVALLGILVMSAVMLWTVQRIFTGAEGETADGFGDLRAHEVWAIAPLVILSLVIGLAPQPMLGMIAPASNAVISLIGR